MEYLTGIEKKDTLEISELLAGEREGTKVKVNGAVHAIRDMGTIAFIILRKREGLLHGVYEEGVSGISLKEVKDAETIEIEGVLEKNEKAPQGIEIRMESLRILSEPEDERMPLSISKWKLNTSLDAKLNYRSISLRNIRERAKFKLQAGISSTARVLRRSTRRRSVRRVRREARICSGWNISTGRQSYSRAPSCISR